MPRRTRAHIRRYPILGLAVACAALAGCSSDSPTPVGTSKSPSPARPDTHAASATAPTTSTATRASSSTLRPSPSRSAGEFTVAFAGDVHFSGRLAPRLATNPATVFAQAAPVLRKADLTMVNLETAITTGGVRQDKAFAFHAPPSALTALRKAGIDVATMANNHGADYGASGVRDSLRAIKASGFPVIGIGANAHQAFAPYRTTINGQKVAIFAADQVNDETTLRLFSAGRHRLGVANAHSPRLLRGVRTAVRAGWLVIVYLHWGIEYQACPSDEQTSLAASLAAAGASAIVGTHAHVLQGAGWRQDGSYVAYGLGNYLWWRSFGNAQDDNGVLTLRFRDGTVVADHFAASHLDQRGVPVPATGATRARILAEWNHDRACTELSATAPTKQ